MKDENREDSIGRAAEAIARADALLIAAGAGMGVDSGLPDFRGSQGFWKAYPPYAKLGLSFARMANPAWFHTDPEFAWGFYGHRLNLYRGTPPHEGFSLLHEWGKAARSGFFVFTSNVDGHFQRAGFDPGRIVEIHGAIDWLQCFSDCGSGIFPAEAREISIDESTMRANGPLPSCPECGSLARPNILMFGDGGWDSAHSDCQADAYHEWLRTLPGTKLAVIEIGAGTAIPSVRYQCEGLAHMHQGSLIRINPREPEVPRGQIGLAMGAVEALRAIASRL